MNKSVGFTLIELMIVLAMCAIIGTIIVRVASGDGNNYTYGANGMTETRCINVLMG